jgi:hypothetical protein
MLSNASNSSATEEIIKIGTYKLKNDEYFKLQSHQAGISDFATKIILSVMFT